MRSGLVLAGAALLAALSACGGSPTQGSSTTVSPSAPPPGSTSPTGPNAMRVSVNGSLCAAGSFLDEPCVSITVCTPDQTSCQIVSDVLLDTGSFGLRLFKQAATLTLPKESASGATLATCARFGDGSSDWGPVVRAAVLLGQEPAVVVDAQLIDATFGPPPASCGAPDASPAAAGFNGILGVGPFVTDCGPACAASANNGVYYACSGGSCTGVAVPESSQLQNPAAMLAADGAGLVVHLPGVPSAGARSAEGELRLGLGTASNNQPTGVTALALDGFGEFRATAMGQTFAAFVDTGSNGLFFTPPASVTTLVPCAAPLAGWFCPATTQHFDATATGAAGGGSVAIGFDVADFATLVSGSNAVFDSDAGSGIGPGLFDFGLPFHLGRDVFVVFDGKSSPLGTGPLVAF